MKIKLLTLLTILTVSLAVSTPTTSARALIEGGGAPAPVTAPTPTVTNPTTSNSLFNINALIAAFKAAMDSVIAALNTITTTLNTALKTTFNPTTSPINPSVSETCTASGSSSVTKKVGEQFTVSWCAINAKSCSVTGPEFPSGVNCLADASSATKRGSSNIIISTPGTYTYTITGDGKTAVAIVTIVPDVSIPTNINVPSQPASAPAPAPAPTPTCTIGAKPTSVKLPNSSTFLEWSCNTNINGCTITDNNPKVADIGAVASSGSRETPIVGSTTKFTLKCPGAADASVTVGLFNSSLKEIIPQ